MSTHKTPETLADVKTRETQSLQDYCCDLCGLEIHKGDNVVLGKYPIPGAEAPAFHVHPKCYSYAVWHFCLPGDWELFIKDEFDSQRRLYEKIG